jgi:hypothetical protein
MRVLWQSCDIGRGIKWRIITGGGGKTGISGERSGKTRVRTHSATLVTEEVCNHISGGTSKLKVGGRLGQSCPRQAPNDKMNPPRRHGRDRGRGRRRAARTSPHRQEWGREGMRWGRVVVARVGQTQRNENREEGSVLG